MNKSPTPMMPCVSLPQMWPELTNGPIKRHPFPWSGTEVLSAKAIAMACPEPQEAPDTINKVLTADDGIIHHRKNHQRDIDWCVTLSFPAVVLEDVGRERDLFFETPERVRGPNCHVSVAHTI
eukprot:scaffold36476_cov252-Amphora_coffeaeformis.AAC.8